MYLRYFFSINCRQTGNEINITESQIFKQSGYHEHFKITYPFLRKTELTNFKKHLEMMVDDYAFRPRK